MSKVVGFELWMFDLPTARCDSPQSSATALKALKALYVSLVDYEYCLEHLATLRFSSRNLFCSVAVCTLFRLLGLEWQM